MSCIDKQNILKHASSDEERLVLAKAYDAFFISEKTGRPRFSGFLSPADRDLVCRAFSKSQAVSFFGGYDEAERQIVGFSAEEESDFPILVICCTGDFSALTHRDFLGSLMGLGITRENVGDIVLEKDSAYIFVTDTLSEYIKDNLTQVGRIKVSCTLSDLSDVSVKREYDEMRKSVASLRSDAVIGAIFGLSRSDASEVISRGLTSVNYKIIQDTDKKINDGDIISVKGRGKSKIFVSGDTSKKGRYFIDIKKYK